MSKKVVILSEDDFNSILANLHDAYLETRRMSSSHSQSYIQMKIEQAFNTLNKEDAE